MKLLALLTPVVMLGALWVLQRLEAWMSHPLGQARPRSPRRGQRHTSAPSPQRRLKEADHA
jgi:hypothetical protein